MNRIKHLDGLFAEGMLDPMPGQAWGEAVPISARVSHSTTTPARRYWGTGIRSLGNPLRGFDGQPRKLAVGISRQPCR